MTHRSGHERMCPGPHQFMMQRVAKTARLINGMDRVSRVHLGPNPAEQACAGEALPPLDVTSAALDRRHRIIQIHIQAKLENLPRSRIATSQRGVRLIVVMKGWGCFIFHNLRCALSTHALQPFMASNREPPSYPAFRDFNSPFRCAARPRSRQLIWVSLGAKASI